MRQEEGFFFLILELKKSEKKIPCWETGTNLDLILDFPSL